jgi:hypothetical protein
MAGPASYDEKIAFAFQCVALGVAASAAYILVGTTIWNTPDLPADLQPGLAIAAGAGCVLGLLGAWLLPPGIKRGDLRVIRTLGLLMLLPAAPLILGLALSAMNPIILLTSLFSIVGIPQVAWIAMTGVLLVRGFSSRLN